MALSCNVKIRPFLPSDFPAAATVAAAAMQDDELFVFLCPYRGANPGSFRQHFLRRLKKRYYSGDHLLWVAEAESLVTVPPKGMIQRKVIVGLVICSRKGNSDRAATLMKKQGWLDAIEQRLLSLERCYVNLFRLDKSVSKCNIAKFEAATESSEDPFASFPERWHLNFLVVDPDFQRQGIGSQLVQRLLKLAQSERIPIALIGSQKGKLFYRRMGFTDVRVSWVAEGVEGMAMIWTPDRVESVL